MSKYGPMSADESSAVSRIVSLCFAGPREAGAAWLAQAGHEHVRVVRGDDGGAAGCLLRIVMGQFFGGRSVPMVGIAGVGVAPELRGGGIAGEMMAAAVREMHDEGVPLSCLYASTQPLYRRAGYEQAGHRFEIRVPMQTLDVRERGMTMRAIEDEDEEQIRGCYRGFAAHFDGQLDRGAYIWNRVVSSGSGKYDGFAAVNEAGAIEGYTYVVVRRKGERGRQEVALTDFAFTTERAARRLLTLLADFGSIADEAAFYGGPMHPALFLLSQQRFRIDLRDHWMLRIVNVAGALEGRGYAPRITARIAFDVRDSLLAENGGRWLLNVEGGAGRVERGGDGAGVSLDVGALASLYSGYLSATQLRLLGRLEGSDDAVGACDAVFGGMTPWMGDSF